MILQSNDPILANKNTNDIAPEFDLGIEYKGPFKLGASVKHLGFFGNWETDRPAISVWTYISSRFNIVDDVSIEPCLSYIARDNIHYGEGGAIFYFLKTKRPYKYNDKFWVGAMYATHGQFTTLAGMHFTPKMRLGYSFTYGVGNIASLSKAGTHELFFSWQFDPLFYKDAKCW